MGALTMYGLKLGEHHDVVHVRVSGRVIGAAAGDEPQPGMVDRAVNRLGRKPGLGVSRHPADGEDGSRA